MNFRADRSRRKGNVASAKNSRRVSQRRRIREKEILSLQKYLHVQSNSALERINFDLIVTFDHGW